MPSTLMVRANPYAHIDAQGRPAGACPCDPLLHTPDRRWVGAVVRSQMVRPADPPLFQVDDNWFEFSRKPVPIPDTQHYQLALRAGDLLPADKATANAAGLEFVDPEVTLAARAQATQCQPVSWLED